MSIFIEISNKELTESDISMICSIEKGLEKYVMVKDCWIEDLDISTTNPNVVAQSCYFVNSEMIAPPQALLRSECNIFTGSKGDKLMRYQMRGVIKCIGYYNPIVA